MLTVGELADYLRVHPSTIYRVLKRHELPAFKVGRDWRFTMEEIDRWLGDGKLGQPAIEIRTLAGRLG